MLVPVADQLEKIVRDSFGVGLPIRFRAWDGSAAGPDEPGAPVAVLKSRDALRRLVWNPGELGLSRAYVAGELDVEGDLKDALARFWALGRQHQLSGLKPSVGARLTALRTAVSLGAFGPKPKAPTEEARLSGRLHTKDRDSKAISHHYDLSNEFYQLILEPNMAYSCGYWTSTKPEYTVQDAQRDKLDLICRKLDLQPGMRMLDVGCGWGSLIIHAAKHYGANVTGVTISAEQRKHILNRVEAEGLQDKVQVRLQDYRDVSDEPFDAIGTIEMGEHVGNENYDTYTATLFRLLKPYGRLLLQQMSRGTEQPGGGAFIEGYVAPDMHMEPLGKTVARIEAAGLEVRDVHALREHYVYTVDAWARTLEEKWDEAVALVGEGQARVWRLYMAGGSLTFEQNRMGVNQILAVRPTPEGNSAFPAVRPNWSDLPVR
ncbi:class I SAM-dependent methyltransferase [Pseudonocardiaceae bacterium YIM PH 21723]|nr:class I SAM-dependent methyltransferase [Pseudonocardiaceae bacterium YIM PH 21723]